MLGDIRLYNNASRSDSYRYYLTQLNMGGSHDALRGNGVTLRNVRAGLIASTTQAFTAVELMP
jgi:hypothetical protein